MIEICALASGSNGNCYYIGNETEAVLIDAGIYYKRLDERLKTAGLQKEKIKAVFISHEHNDHIQGLRVTSKKLGIPGILTKATYHKAYDKNKPEMFSFFNPGEPYKLNHFTVHPFRKNHDAKDPCSFRVEVYGKSIGVMTDIGEVDEILRNEFSKCDAVFLEANYDKEMLWNGFYPYHLKQRVDSSIGHLSNDQALELTKGFASANLKTIFLSHISASNNTRELALETFNELKDRYDIRLTSRTGISDVVRLIHT